MGTFPISKLEVQMNYILYLRGWGENTIEIRNAITYCLSLLPSVLGFFKCISEYFYAFQSLLLKPNLPFSSIRRRDVGCSTTHETAMSPPLPKAQGT